MRLRLALATIVLGCLPLIPIPAAAKVSVATDKVRVLLKVPMVYQAPFGVWDRIHEDTCEEAALTMVKGFTEKRASYTKQEMDDRLLKLVDWEMKTFGFFESTSAALVVKMAKEQLGLDLEVKPVRTAEDIKRELRAGRPVILPTAGKLLANPNFQHGGPPYHMLVVKGYTDYYFITNDPGTRKGLNYYYPQWRLVLAAHDWHKTDPTKSPKVMLVLKTAKK
jgi:hypothetical protein